MKLVIWRRWKPWMTVLTLMVVNVCPVLAVDSPVERETLTGLTGVHVVVEEMNPAAEKDGLTEFTLQMDVELKLRQAGIRVLTSGERLVAPGNPYLYLRVGTIKNEMGLYAFDTDLELRQEVRLTRNPAITSLAATWSARGRIGSIGSRNLPSVRDSVRDQVDEFLNAYLAANPKR